MDRYGSHEEPNCRSSSDWLRGLGNPSPLVLLGRSRNCTTTTRSFGQYKTIIYSLMDNRDDDDWWMGGRGEENGDRVVRCSLFELKWDHTPLIIHNYSNFSSINLPYLSSLHRNPVAGRWQPSAAALQPLGRLSRSVTSSTYNIRNETGVTQIKGGKICVFFGGLIPLNWVIE